MATGSQRQHLQSGSRGALRRARDVPARQTPGEWPPKDRAVPQRRRDRYEIGAGGTGGPAHGVLAKDFQRALENLSEREVGYPSPRKQWPVSPTAPCLAPISSNSWQSRLLPSPASARMTTTSPTPAFARSRHSTSAPNSRCRPTYWVADVIHRAIPRLYSRIGSAAAPRRACAYPGTQAIPRGRRTAGRWLTMTKSCQRRLNGSLSPQRC